MSSTNDLDLTPHNAHLEPDHPEAKPFDAQPFLLVTAIVTAIALMFSAAYSSWISAHAHSSSCARTGLMLDAVQSLAFDFIDPPTKPGALITKAKAERIKNAELDVTNRLNTARCGGNEVVTVTTTTTGGP